MKQRLLIITCFCLLLFSCKKEKLPKATEEGKSTFGCKVDGNVFLPEATAFLA